MPKPKKKQYEDAMGSVFDFIFTESKKPVNKQKPVKVTGVDGTYEYVDAIAAVLENPAKFVNKTTVDAFNDLVNPELAAVDLGCLLYTSDAADDLLCVDLGGRRIIKKKQQ